ncbi:MAG: hypothetical protein LKF61_00810 [Eggerthellaceae bacterium]|jgi:hypothetical protein|nr:hypothetical protein [Eggerthellaceae bacterium]MCH4220491.1 hypothetical protein [Eggerthellaceae bacterium]
MSSKSDLGLTKPSLADTFKQLVDGIAGSMDSLDKRWPIHSIYMSAASTNPGDFIGGTWHQIQGRFLIGASAEYPAGTTGGAATHHHTQTLMFNDNNCYKAGQGCRYTDGDSVPGSDHETKDASSIPPYYSVYIWERVA